MDKQQVLDLLSAHKHRLEEFAVETLFLFSSVARDEATSDSDVDFWVEFNRPVGLLNLLGLKAYLEELIGCAADEGTPKFIVSSPAGKGAEGGDSCRLGSLNCGCRIC
ncbi:MAG: nucleotidyltransferase domain-containing protein [Cyanobacteria bacterium P01_A01_bin.37]